MGSGYPGPRLDDDDDHHDDEQDVIATAVAEVDGRHRTRAEEIDDGFAKEIIRLGPDRPISPQILEKIDKFPGSA
jgi:hypothetical protein